MPALNLPGKTLGLAALLALSAGIPAVAVQNPPSADTQAAALYQAATEAQQKGDYPRAISAYQKLLELHPESAETHANLGMMYYASGQYDKAISALEAAVRIKPQLYAANLVLGMTLVHKGQLRQACLYLKRAHLLNSTAVEPVMLLAQARAARQDYRVANAYYLLATQLDSRNGDAWFGLGSTYLRITADVARQLRESPTTAYFGESLTAESLEERGAFRDAAEVYRKLVAEFPQQPGLHTGLGFSLAFAGDPSLLVAAANEFQADLNAHPGYLPARIGLARVALQQRKLEDFLAQLQAVWDIDPDYVRSNASRLWIGMPPDRLSQLKHWLGTSPRSGADSGEAAFLSQALEKWTQAPASALAAETDVKDQGPSPTEPAKQTSAPADPKQCYATGHYSQCAKLLQPRLGRLAPPELELLAECSYLRGDYLTTFQVGQRLLVETGSAKPEALFWQARAAPKLAFAALARAAEIQPDSPRVHFLLGQSYLENKSYQAAAPEYLRALEVQPDFLAARLGLATAYWGAGQPEQALTEARAAVEQSPNDPEAACLLAELLMARRQYAAAAPYLDKALRSPQVDASRVHALRSRVLRAQGKTTEAVAEMKQALASDVDGSYHFQLAQMYRRLGDTEAAASALAQSEKIRNANRDKHNPMPLSEAMSDGSPPDK
jgi:tetratricopeptide (TPR) repeat protein